MLDEDFYSFKHKYRYVKHNEAANRFILIIVIAILTAIFFCVRNFVRDMNKFGIWSDGIRSIILLTLSNIVLYSMSFANNNYGIFFWGLITSFIVFCIYWHMILNPKNQIYNAAILQENQTWWQFDGWEFEKEVGKLFESCGYRVQVTKGSGDGGVDVILYKDGVKSIVQCKHHQNPVSIEPIRALWGCMQDFNANEAIFIASSGYTSGCYDFVHNKTNYKLLTLDDLSVMAAQLHGRLKELHKNKFLHSNKGIKIVLPLYLLLCSIILTYIYYPSNPKDNKPQQEQQIEQTKQDSQNNSTEIHTSKSNFQTNNYLVENNNSTEFNSYMQDLVRHIKTNWDPPRGTNLNGSIDVLMEIAKNGNLISANISKSSGYPIEDTAALNAIKISAPFRPLPTEFKGESITIKFTFDRIVHENTQ